MEKLKVAVIGLGFIGELHARIFHEDSNAQVALVVDFNLDRAKELGEKYGCAYAKTLSEGMKLAEVDAVSICTPDDYHLENVKEAVKFGLDILLEKPLAGSYDDAKEIIELCEATNVRLMVAHILHFDPRYAMLRDSIQQGDFGEMVHMYFRRTNPRANAWRLKGSVSIMQFIGVHDFEMLTTYMNSKPVRVYSQMVSKVNKEINSEDTVISTITFENGAVGLVELCWALPNNASLGIDTFAQIVGTESVGIIEIKNQGLAIVNEKEVEYPDTLHWPEYNQRIQGDLKEELNHFVLSILDNTEFITKLETAVQAVQIIDACKESIQTNMPVNL